MAKRKSPYKHEVRSHLRSEHRVGRYIRGKGAKPRIAPRRRKLKVEAGSGLGSFDVRLEYQDRSTESLGVQAQSYFSALDQGMVTRKQIKAPVLVALRRVSA